MGLFDMFRRGEPQAGSTPSFRASAGTAITFQGFDDPALLEFIREGLGGLTESGARVSVQSAMKNTTVLRCVSLISFSIGMLPLHLKRKDGKGNATDHPLFRLLHRRPNPWQTAFEFRSLMEQRALTYGGAFARKIKSGNKILHLIPFDPEKTTIRQRSDWHLEFVVDRGQRGPLVLPQDEVFHLRYGLSEDGFTGLSLVKQAAEAIGLAQQTERAAARLFRNGMIVGGALKHPGKLSQEAYERLKESMNATSGAENAHLWKILEEGMSIEAASGSSRDSQGIENRKLQIEEVARPFGVPRPLLNVDDTSWGSGIDVLGQLFVRYGLNPWFEAWQQAIERDLLTEAEADLYEAKFNPGGLLRGSLKDQAEFFAKALGAGGHQPWALWSEVRDAFDMPVLDKAPPPPPGLAGKGAKDEPA